MIHSFYQKNVTEHKIEGIIYFNYQDNKKGMAYLKLTLGFSECKANESLRLQIISESLIHVFLFKFFFALLDK